ncbi:MAG: hypothetical protein NUV67_00415, partial [archaeon]|nr:hypothetical protein [archaeon]
SPSKRGNLLSVERQGNSTNLEFGPSLATPVLMRIAVDTISDDSLSAFYTVTSSNAPVDVGGTMAFWEGAGACLDPTGNLITESFDYKPDRAAVSSDAVSNWNNSYAIDFGEVSHLGDSYVRTIFYTNPQDDIAIRSEHPKANMQFITPDESGEAVPLAGVAGSGFNSATRGTEGGISSMEDLFNLVGNEVVCVVDSGREASFFWNPKAIYELKGKNLSVSEFTNSLAAGDTCIG